MSTSFDDIRRQLAESASVKASFSAELVARIDQLVQKSASTVRGGGKLVFFGNGGSAADAQHLAAELVVRLNADRPGVAALALTTNTSILTAAANDYGFDRVFARQIESLVSAEDVLIALSTSGNSPNVVLGVEAGRKRGAFVAALTGSSGGALAARVDLLLNVPSTDAQRIQEAHITIGHIVCALLESQLFRKS